MDAHAESQNKYQALLDSLDALVWEGDVHDFHCTFVSPQVERLLGYTPEQWLKDLSWTHIIHADDLDRVLAVRRSAVAVKRNHEIEFRVLAADGRAVWVRDTATVVVEHDRPVKIRGVMVVITQRKELEAQLQQSQKMEAVGKLAGGIAHDFNNFLTIIMGYSELMLGRIAADHPLRADIEEIKKAGTRAAALTQQLLAFSRRQVLMPKVLDLNAIVSGMSAMLQRLLGEDINLVTNLDRSIGRVNADPGQLEQVIMNLVVNARDAMPKGGKLTIETGRVDVRGADAPAQDLTPGRYVALTVSDTGSGMDPATKARVFEPFFTTKERGKGTGLGLSTVYGIVKQSGGGILVHSELGRGATFSVYLPEVEAPVERAAGEDPGTGLPHGTETVLLVEDEPSVRTLVSDTLRMHGYTVLEARHGIEALLIGGQHTGPIHLLLTDVVMPQMSGREVADQLRQVRPGVIVLYMSGYAEDAVIQHGAMHSGTAFLHKPFAPDDLVRKVRTVLDAGRGRTGAMSPRA
jgi:PAS domain S-box-containing protein